MRNRGWFTVIVSALLALCWLAGAGCSSNSGSKEFIPGKGWRNT